MHTARRETLSSKPTANPQQRVCLLTVHWVPILQASPVRSQCPPEEPTPTAGYRAPANAAPALPAARSDWEVPAGEAVLDRLSAGLGTVGRWLVTKAFRQEDSADARSGGPRRLFSCCARQRVCRGTVLNPFARCEARPGDCDHAVRPSCPGCSGRRGSPATVTRGTRTLKPAKNPRSQCLYVLNIGKHLKNSQRTD